jgi:alpha/beta superfamily hydrolase
LTSILHYALARRRAASLSTGATAAGANTRIERLFIAGLAGKLEAILDFDAQAVPRSAAVVCHPHPLRRGTLHNKVVFRAAQAALDAGLPALRFNFRGVGQSEGKYDGGVGERDDVRAALDYLQERFPGTRACVIGFSFGAWVGLAVGELDPRVDALIGLALPTSDLNFDYLREVRKPKLIVQGTHDQFATRAEVEALFASMPEPKRLQWIEGADHLFTEKLDEVRSALRGFLREVVKP